MFDNDTYARPPRTTKLQTALDDDDLFARPTRIAARNTVQEPPTARITCRVCGLRVAVQLDHPALLCSNCLIDLTITRAHVSARLDAAEQAHARAWSAFDAALAGASEADQARYAAVVEAQHKMEGGALSAAAYDAGIARAIERGDGLSTILRAKQTTDEAYAALDTVRNWAKLAMGEIEAAENTTKEQPHV